MKLKNTFAKKLSALFVIGSLAIAPYSFAQELRIFVSDSTASKTVSFSGAGTDALEVLPQALSYIAIDSTNTRLYGISEPTMGTWKIVSAELDGTDFQEVHTTSNEIRALVVDVTNQKLFFIERKNLYRMNVDGSGLELLLNLTDADEFFVNLAVDSTRSKLLFSTYHNYHVTEGLFQADLSTFGSREGITTQYQFFFADDLGYVASGPKVLAASGADIVQYDLTNFISLGGELGVKADSRFSTLFTAPSGSLGRLATDNVNGHAYYFLSDGPATSLRRVGLSGTGDEEAISSLSLTSSGLTSPDALAIYSAAGSADPDSDGDGTPDSVDGCASDSTKITPGACGCGTEDVDTNLNGIIDCLPIEVPYTEASEMQSSLTTLKFGKSVSGLMGRFRTLRQNISLLEDSRYEELLQKLRRALVRLKFLTENKQNKAAFRRVKAKVDNYLAEIKELMTGDQ